jgi:hypothetical protein
MLGTDLGTSVKELVVFERENKTKLGIVDNLGKKRRESPQTRGFLLDQVEANPKGILKSLVLGQI